jgi:hypothetical protein
VSEEAWQPDGRQCELIVAQGDGKLLADQRCPFLAEYREPVRAKFTSPDPSVRIDDPIVVGWVHVCAECADRVRAYVGDLRA